MIYQVEILFWQLTLLKNWLEITGLLGRNYCSVIVGLIFQYVARLAFQYLAYSL